MAFLAATSCAQTELRGVGPVGPVERIATGFQFVEGPTKGPDGAVFFTDIPANAIHRLSLERDDAASAAVELFLRPSGHANGLMYGGNGRLLVCQMDGRLASIDLSTKRVEVLADTHQGRRFNACNDLVVDRPGGVYFTDPRFRAPDPWPQGVEALFYLSKSGRLTRLAADLKAPNGVILSPDESTLYVAPTLQGDVIAWAVEGPGKLADRRVFCRLEQPPGQTGRGGDGMAVDVQGNLYVTTALGVQVFSSQGELLGIIEVPEVPANCTFAGSDNRTLIITARTSVYRCRVPVAGHQFRDE